MAFDDGRPTIYLTVYTIVHRMPEYADLDFKLLKQNKGGISNEATQRYETQISLLKTQTDQIIDQNNIFRRQLQKYTLMDQQPIVRMHKAPITPRTFFYVLGIFDNGYPDHYLLIKNLQDEGWMRLDAKKGELIFEILKTHYDDVRKTFNQHQYTAARSQGGDAQASTLWTYIKKRYFFNEMEAFRQSPPRNSPTKHQIETTMDM